MLIALPHAAKGRYTSKGERTGLKGDLAESGLPTGLAAIRGSERHDDLGGTLRMRCLSVERDA
jgi:hypothetical protein